MSALSSEATVRYAEPNWLAYPSAIPSDLLFGNQLSLHNKGSGLTVPGIGYYFSISDADIDALEGWETVRTSRNVTTAILDTGIATDHPDLQNQIWTNPAEQPNNIDDDGNGFVDDLHGWDFIGNHALTGDGNGHGTHVAGTIGATGNNNTGVTGVSWDANLMPLKVCYSLGGCPSAAMANAITYAANQGADVINMSIAGFSFSQAIYEAIAAAPNSLFVVAAGNEGVDTAEWPTYPCQTDQHPGSPNLDNLVCVGATDLIDERANFSNYGSTAVDLAAPGLWVASTQSTIETAYAQDFESLPLDFDTVESSQHSAMRWERAKPPLGAGGSTAIADSVSAANLDVPYSPSTSAVVQSSGQGVDLTNRNACHLRYDLKLDSEYDTANPYASDIFYAEAKGASNSSWTILDSYAGDFGEFETSTNFPYNSKASLEDFENDSPVKFRFRFVADADANNANQTGATIDNVQVACAGPSTDAYSFKYGTSMATPHVSGIATLLKEVDPNLSPADLKRAILDGTDPIESFQGLSVTGGRANLAKTVLPYRKPEPPLIQPTDSRSVFDGTKLRVKLSCPARFKPRCYSTATPVTNKKLRRTGDKIGLIGKAMAKPLQVETFSGKSKIVKFFVKPAFRKNISNMVKSSKRTLHIRQLIRTKSGTSQKIRRSDIVFRSYRVAISR